MCGQLDLVTVYFEGDRGLQMLQAKSICRFFDTSCVRKIYVVNNDENYLSSHAVFVDTVLPCYGDKGSLVEYVHWSDLLEGRFSSTGWRSQQALKLKIVSYIETDSYLVLDSKNHFIRPVGRESFFVDKRALTFLTSPRGSLLNYLYHTSEYLGLGPVESGCKVFPAVTPYVLYTGIVKNLLEYVSEREKSSFESYFLGKNRHLTEFYLYYLYMKKFDIDITEIYQIGRRSNISLFTRSPEQEADVNRLIRGLDSDQIKVFGLHRNRLGRLTEDQIMLIIAVWVKNGLFLDQSAALKFFAENLHQLPGSLEPVIESK